MIVKKPKYFFSSVYTHKLDYRIQIVGNRPGLSKKVTVATNKNFFKDVTKYIGVSPD